MSHRDAILTETGRLRLAQLPSTTDAAAAHLCDGPILPPGQNQNLTYRTWEPHANLRWNFGALEFHRTTSVASVPLVTDPAAAVYPQPLNFHPPLALPDRSGSAVE